MENNLNSERPKKYDRLFEKISVVMVALAVVGIMFFEVRRSIRETPVIGHEDTAGNSYRGITSGNLMQMIEKDEDFLLIDVRSTRDFNKGHITGSISIPVSEIDRYTDLPRHKTIVLYDMSGPWSRQAYNLLKAQGFTNIRVLANGIVGWKWEVQGKLVRSP